MTTAHTVVATCPNCGAGLTDQEISSLNAKRLVARRTRSGPIGILGPCRYCLVQMSRSARRRHEPHCPKKA